MPAAVHFLYMSLLSDAERSFAEAVSRLANVNPFVPERIEGERRALGDEHVPFDAVWHSRGDAAGENPNEARIVERSASLVEAVRARLAGGGRGTSEELALYQDVVLHLLYYRYQARELRFLRGVRGGRRALSCGGAAAEPPRSGASVRLLLPGPPRLSLHLPCDRRRLAAGGAAAGAGLAIDFHP
jgi:hypothetical protein